MARDIAQLYTVTGTLETLTPIHVGNLDGNNPDSDMPLAQDGRGRYYIPGTSLAGALRQWSEQNPTDGQETRFLWGFVTPGKSGAEDTRASSFTIDDAVIASGKEEIRDGVHIEAVSGTAADKGKYDLAILPRGTTMSFCCSLALGTNHIQGEKALAALLRALSEDKIRLGAARTRGLGKVQLDRNALRVTRATLNTRAGMLQHLRGQDEVLQGPGKTWSLLEENLVQPVPAVDITINWKPITGLMVRAGIDGIAVDGLPLVSAFKKERVACVVPGSSLKGILRSRAQLIINTVQPTNKRLKDLEAWLFGTARASENNAANARTTSGDGNGAGKTTDDFKGMGMLTVDDCYARTLFRKNDWENFVTSVKEDDARAQLGNMSTLDLTPDGVEQPSPSKASRTMDVVSHVAIDRWTGGAADQRLFNQVEPRGLAWEPMHLVLDFSRISKALPADEAEAVEQQMLALILLVLRDMASGRVPVGFGTNRGMGDITLEQATLRPQGLSWWQEDTPLVLEHGNLGALSSNVLETLNKSWKATTLQGGQNE